MLLLGKAGEEMSPGVILSFPFLFKDTIEMSTLSASLPPDGHLLVQVYWAALFFVSAA